MHVNINYKIRTGPDGMEADLAAECANYERLIAGNGGIDLQYFSPPCFSRQ